MNTTFAKTALAAGVLAGLGYADASMALSLVPNGNDEVILGCALPSAGTTVATVYSVDAYSTTSSAYTISLPTAVAVGQSCAGAIAAMGTVSVGGYFFSVADLVPRNQAIPGSGYSLQEFNFHATATGPIERQAGMGFVGCAAPGSTGGTVYSVDATNVASATGITALNAMVGKPCSWAVAKSQYGTATGFGSSGAYVGEAVLNINSNGYSLNQYSFQ